MQVGPSTVPFKYIEYGVYGDLTLIYPKPKAIFYLLKGDYSVLQLFQRPLRQSAFLRFFMR